MTTYTKSTDMHRYRAAAKWPRKWGTGRQTQPVTGIGIPENALVREVNGEDSPWGVTGFWVQAWIWVPTDEPHEQVVDHT